VFEAEGPYLNVQTNSSENAIDAGRRACVVKSFGVINGIGDE